MSVSNWFFAIALIATALGWGVDRQLASCDCKRDLILLRLCVDDIQRGTLTESPLLFIYGGHEYLLTVANAPPGYGQQFIPDFTDCLGP